MIGVLLSIERFDSLRIHEQTLQVLAHTGLCHLEVPSHRFTIIEDRIISLMALSRSDEHVIMDLSMIFTLGDVLPSVLRLPMLPTTNILIFHQFQIHLPVIRLDEPR